MRNLCAIAVAVVAVSYSVATADTCVINGVTKQCDIICGSGLCQPANFTYCDVTVGDGDGTCTLCGVSSTANTIVGTDTADYICGKNGNDNLSGGLGDDSISGGNDNDTVNGGEGDDYLYGDGGTDNLEGGAGANELFGGSGADIINNTPGVVHSALGSLVCGGSGADAITVSGTGHVCIDAGTQQPSTGTDCTYTTPSLPDVHDVATQINCRNPSGPYYAVTPPRECGCP